MDLYITWQVAALTLVTAVTGVTAVVILTRLNGLRSFAKMAPHDFATTIAIGSVLAGTAMASVPLAQGVTALAGLYLAQRFYRGWRLRGGTAVIDNSPRLLMAGREVQWETLSRSGVTVDDLRGKLREANVLRYDQVRAIVLESTGDISVLHGPADGEPLDPDLLDDVIGAPTGTHVPPCWEPGDGGRSPLEPPPSAPGVGAT